MFLRVPATVRLARRKRYGRAGVKAVGRRVAELHEDATDRDGCRANVVEMLARRRSTVPAVCWSVGG